MKLAGSSALTRVAQNPQCGWQVVMLRSGLSEPDFYQRLTGSPYPREYGERNSARRRGAKFERNAYANNAALLRTALSPLIGLSSDDIWVRNLEDDEPGARDSNRTRRWRLTMAILADHAAGRSVPQLLIQPQLHLQVKGLARRPGLFIAPDVLFLEQSSGRYRPADLKSFVVREHHVAPADLERSRLQVAVQSLALHEGLQAAGDERPVDHRGGFVFATPYGLRPHEPKMESLDASVDCIRKALTALQLHAETIEAAKMKDGALSEALVLDEIPNNFQERCIASCVLCDVCRAPHVARPMDLGDAAKNLLGPAFDLDRAIELMRGAPPVSEDEQRIAAVLAEFDAPYQALRRAA